MATTLPAEPGWFTLWYFDGTNPGHTVFRRPVRAWREFDGQPDLTRPILDDGTKPGQGMLLAPDGVVVEPVAGTRVFACLDDFRADLQARWKEQRQRRRRGR